MPPGGSRPREAEARNSALSNERAGAKIVPRNVTPGAASAWAVRAAMVRGRWARMGGRGRRYERRERQPGRERCQHRAPAGGPEPRTTRANGEKTAGKRLRQRCVQLGGVNCARV
jgi:hypothetical protein